MRWTNALRDIELSEKEVEFAVVLKQDNLMSLVMVLHYPA